MKKLICIGVALAALALSGCVFNPVNVERANVTIYADRVAEAK
ncbi:hypothetical protein [Bordetella genomosp. 9]|nr:hypothetical protein [Bordetella genomosp. 9]